MNINQSNSQNQTAIATLLNLVQAVNALNVTTEDVSDTSTTDLTAITNAILNTTNTTSLVNAINAITAAIAAAFPPVLTSSKTYDPPNIADDAFTSTTVTCSGSALGNQATASFSLDLQGIQMTAFVSSANTVTVTFFNKTGGAIDLASGTLKVWTHA